MRITNTMMSNGMLLALNKNARTVNNYYMQLSTAKKFQQPSEDPISASRALRYRTNVSDTVQFKKNVASASAWMDVTDTAFSNTNELMKERIPYLLNQGANDTYSLEDRKKIVSELDDLIKQIAQNEMNANNAGRYVFSGYKTDEPPILTQATTDKYQITQVFSFEDNWARASYQKADVETASTTYQINELNLAYKNLDSITALKFADSTLTPPTFVTASITSTDPDFNADVYDMSAAPDEIRYIKETGELVMGDNVLKNLMESDLSITYEKTGFEKGEPNPKVYFECTNLTTGIGYELTDDPMLYGVSIGTDIQVNSLARNVLTDNMYAVLTTFTSTIKSITLSTDATLKAKYEKEGYSGDALQEKIDEQKTLERKNAAYISHDMFNGMLGMLDMYVSNVSTEHTSLGTRMNRVDLIDSRLGDDEYNFTKLLSDNEDTDFMEAIMKINTAETTYQSAMKIGSKMMQLSLVDFM